MLPWDHLKNGLYEFPSTFLSPPTALLTFGPETLSISITLGHSRLGHPSTITLTKALISCNIAHQSHKQDICTICQLAKSHKLPFVLSKSRALHPLALIHTDLWAPTPYPSITSAWYFLVVLDDSSRFSWTIFFILKIKPYLLLSSLKH